MLFGTTSVTRIGFKYWTVAVCFFKFKKLIEDVIVGYLKLTWK